ncbi:MAG: rhodanese-like domain-containing protein [Agarilytica sp.]
MLFLSEQWILVSVLAVLVSALMFVESKRGGKALTMHQVTMLVNKGEAVVLDIREAKDYKAGHIVDAINIPQQKLAKRVSELEKHKDKVVVIVDKMGQGVGAAAKTLQDQAFSVNRMKGGMMEWTGQNLPVVKG